MAISTHWQFDSELGGALWDSSLLNPVFVNLLIPFGLMAIFISSRWRWLVLGIAIGMTAFMVMALLDGPYVLVAWRWDDCANLSVGQSAHQQSPHCIIRQNGTGSSGYCEILGRFMTLFSQSITSSPI